MNLAARKAHWEKIYSTKPFEAVSWYQQKPDTSLEFLEALNLPKSARIIDIGGGTSYLTDFLLRAGYTNLSVLDVSGQAIAKAKARLQEESLRVNWIESDITDFVPEQTYDLWHDRACFHFLTTKEEIERYVQTAAKAVAAGGKLIMGTFSDQGPTKCSGITIRQYAPEALKACLAPYFESISCRSVLHPTPFGTTQHFTFCSFRRKDKV